MWKRRDPSEPEPAEEEKLPAPPAASTPPAPPAPPQPPAAEVTVTEAPVGEPTMGQNDDPYAQLENFFNEPLVLEDIPPVSPSSAPSTQSEPPPAAGTATASLAETVQRLDQFGRRLAARFEALEGHVQQGSAQTLEALRRLGERMGAELAMLEKRAVNMELTMARLRASTEALELSLQKLPEVRTGEGAKDVLPTEPAAPEPSPVEPELPPPVPSLATPADDPRPDAPPPAPADALFTLEEEVPPEDWDDIPPDDLPPPAPTWP